MGVGCIMGKGGCWGAVALFLFDLINWWESVVFWERGVVEVHIENAKETEDS
jgi:hypothetical protein